MTGVTATPAAVGRLTVRPCAGLEGTKNTSASGFGLRVGKGSSVRAPTKGVKGRSGGRRESVVLQSYLTFAWQDSRMCSKVLRHLVPVAAERGDHHGPLVVDELGGLYEETFGDVQKHLLDYFTYKAVRTVLAQLSEMNPHQYAWFYKASATYHGFDNKWKIDMVSREFADFLRVISSFVVNNKPQDSKYFIRLLVKERQELGERVMVTRLHLFNKWVKKYNHAQLHKAISDQNLELLRERLIQTVKFSNSIGDDIETIPP